MPKTIVAILTPLGEGGIGVVGLLGPQATSIAGPLFRGSRVKDLTSAPSERLAHGYIHDETGPLDEVIVHVSRFPPSQGVESTQVPCGQSAVELIEINCHGGVVAVRKVLELCRARGATEVTANEFAADLAAYKGLDAIQREALVALVQARTQLAALVLLDQLNGALSRVVRSMADRLEDLRADRAPADVAHDLAMAIEALLRDSRLGVSLVQPRRLVVVGKPNVGKSTLVNNLVAEDRVLVHPLPGTTRDAVATMVEISGVPFELVDTAGIRELPAGEAVAGPSGGAQTHQLEMLGIEQTWREVAAADIILALLDNSRPLDGNDARILAALQEHNVIFVMTKTDLPGAFDLSVVTQAARAPICFISAQTGAGVDTLCHAILERVCFVPYEPARPVPFTPRQTAALHSAAQALRARSRRSTGLITHVLHSLLSGEE